MTAPLTDRRRLLAASLSGLSLALAGCASIRPAPASADMPHWSGRLVLQVENDPRQSFSASFDLRGSPSEGALELGTALGGTAALLEWSAAGARLRMPGEPVRQADSLATLVQEAAGTEVPVAALFDWLEGRPTVAEGWQADLSQRPQGRLQARRLQPPAQLRLVLDNP